MSGMRKTMKREAAVKMTLRNGTIDFLLYSQGAEEKGIEVRVQDGTVWLNQAGIDAVRRWHRKEIIWFSCS